MAQHSDGFEMSVVRAAIVAGAVLVAFVAEADQRPHPTLIDPTTTACRVCHTTVEATHADGLRARACLDCHAFSASLNRTFLTTDAAPQAAAPASAQVDNGRVEAEVPAVAAPAAGAAGDPSPGRPPDEPSPVDPEAPLPHAPNAVTSAAPSQTEAVVQATPVADAIGNRSSQLYSDGLRAFRQSDFDDAFETWRLMLAGNPDAVVLQVEVDTYLESARSTLARFDDHGLYVVKKDGLHYVLAGVFGSEDEAFEGLRRLPSDLRSAGAFPIEARAILTAD